MRSRALIESWYLRRLSGPCVVDHGEPRDGGRQDSGYRRRSAASLPVAADNKGSLTGFHLHSHAAYRGPFMSKSIERTLCMTPPALNPAEAKMITYEWRTKGENVFVDLFEIHRIHLDLQSHPNLSPFCLAQNGHP